MAGVGGQGVLIASECLALAALAEGFEAKQSEVHGVAQRGGSVVSHVRFGPKVFSPLIPCGEADLLYAGEALEALRYAHYLKPGGVVVMDERAIKPIQMPGTAAQPYPDNASEFLREKGYSVFCIPALDKAIGLGEKRCANVVLLGAMSKHMPLRPESWKIALGKRLPSRILALNLCAFEEGLELSRVPTV